MRPFALLPAPLRLSALVFVFARAGVDAQSASICDGAVTVTYIPEPFTVTVFTTTNATSLLPGPSSIGLPITNSQSGLPSLSSPETPETLPTNLPSTSLPGITPTGLSGISLSTASVSVPDSLGLSSDVLPTGLSSDALSLSPSQLASLSQLSISPSGSLSLPLVSASLTVPSTGAPTLITPGAISASDLIPSVTTSFDLNASQQSVLSSPGVPSLSGVLPTLSSLGSVSFDGLTSISPGAGVSVPDLSLSVSSISLGLTTPGGPSPSGISVSLPDQTGDLTLSVPSITLTGPSATISIPTVQPSLSSSVPSVSVSLPAVSLSSGLTALTLSSTTLSLNSLTLSPSLPVLSLSLSAIPSGLTTSLATLTGPSISLSPATALPSLPSTSLSGSLPGGLPTLSSSVPNLPTTIFGSRTTGSVTAVPTASVLALVYCPSDNGLNYLSPDNRPFQVECGTRRLGRILSQNLEPNLQTCMDSCDDVPECQSVSYSPSNGTCSYQPEPGTEAIEVPDSSWLSASTVDLSCPGADSSQYMDYTGSVYQVLCDYLFPQSTNITTAPGRDYLDCSSTCSKTMTCTGFSYSDGFCTFTQGFGEPPNGVRRNGTNTVVMLAKRAVTVDQYGNPVVSLNLVATIPLSSVSGLLSPVTSAPASVVTGIGSITGTLLPPITTTSLGALSSSLTTILPSIPSQTGSLSLGSLSASITNDLPKLSTPSISIASNSLSTSISPISITIPTLSLPTTLTNGFSATLPTSQLPTQTPVSYTCPQNSNQIVVENGLSYVLNCNGTTHGEAYSSKMAASNFNDCFLECDQSSTETGARYCTAFTYEGAENGVGQGTCYLFNGVSQGFLPPMGRKAITAIRAVNYVPGAVVDGLSSLVSSLSLGLPTISLGLPTTSLSLPATTLSLPPTTSLNSLASIKLPTSNPASPATLLPSLITTDCSAGGNVLNACITATLGAGVGANTGIAIGPSGSPIIAASLSATLGVSLSAGVDLGVGIGLSSGLSIGLQPSIGLGLGVTGGLGGGLGLGGLGGGGGGAATSTPALAGAVTTSSASRTSSSTSFYVTPLGPVVTTTGLPTGLSTTTVFTTSTITSCLTGLGGVLTCPIGGLFTTLPSTSGAVTSISTSTSISIQTSVSVSISYITVTASATPSSTPSPTPSSTFSTLTTFTTSRSTSTSTAAASSSTAVCKGTINLAGLCVLPL